MLFIDVWLNCFKKYCFKHYYSSIFIKVKDYLDYMPNNYYILWTLPVQILFKDDFSPFWVGEFADIRPIVKVI